MAIHPTCDRCSKELEVYGAILLSPPNAENLVDKKHLCTACYAKIVAEFT